MTIIKLFRKLLKQGSEHVTSTLNGEIIGSIYLTKNSEVHGKLIVGRSCSMGTSCFFRGDIEWGSYVQIGNNVSFHSRNHPVNTITTYQGSDVFNGQLKTIRSEKRIMIGNDVWIGHGAIILSGVKIGNGAIIGAGSVVTKDVEDYSIITGIPGHCRRKRFKPETVKALNRIEWWNWDKALLERHKNLFFITEDEGIQAYVKKYF